ncbi:transcription factor iib [Lentinula edodes]|uniref:Transcription factor iib n=1 Tax=Lentinula edodes TaxID=5353 RepID=A0A1Q3EP29_LENED|nr:transcription factor iib [Lentinula edodes]
MSREWSFEVGIADRVGRKGIIRFSTFQKQPRLKVPADSNGLPLLHLPFSFPSDSTQLTAWSTEIFKHIYKPGEKNLKPKISTYALVHMEKELFFERFIIGQDLVATHV